MLMNTQTVLFCVSVVLQGEFVACLLALLRQMTDRHYQQLLQAFSSKDDLRVRPPHLSLHVHLPGADSLCSVCGSEVIFD